ncbi:MAG: AMP-binding protein [Gemmatimonadetes bacterium]|nr:AMP-binding protein [Gemmatimonadota bacterium]
MAKFVISPHFRLQEWVAEEKGYFADEGLDYEFREAISTRDAKRQNLGDRVGAYMPMAVEVAIQMFACFKTGAIFVPIFSGFAAPALAERLRDAGARLLFTADETIRRAAAVPIKSNADLAAHDVPTLERLVVVRRGTHPLMWHEGRDVTWEDFLASGKGAPSTEAMDSMDPALILYTSGTTGRPKGTVHSHAGSLVQIAKELAYQFDLKTTDRFFWLTDIGWMMGPWALIGGLFHGATVVIYDGAIDVPKPDRLWDMIQRHGITVFGISPTAVRMLMRSGEAPLAGHDLSTLRILGSTGEPWDEASWRWLFDKVGGTRCPIINISGGTDLIGGFLSPLPVQPLKPCTLVGPGLGMAIDVWDDKGHPVRGRVGYLVVTQPSPSMTRGLWNDSSRYLESYWSRWEDVWNHGDWAYVDEDGYWFLQGRADDTLKVAGHRIGPAEVEGALIGSGAVSEAAAVGVPHDIKGEAIVCFVVLRPGHAPSDKLRSGPAQDPECQDPPAVGAGQVPRRARPGGSLVASEPRGAGGDRRGCLRKRRRGGRSIAHDPREKTLQVQGQRLRDTDGLPRQCVAQYLRPRVSGPPAFDETCVQIHDPVFIHAGALIALPLGAAIVLRRGGRQHFDRQHRHAQLLPVRRAGRARAGDDKVRQIDVVLVEEHRSPVLVHRADAHGADEIVHRPGQLRDGTGVPQRRDARYHELPFDDLVPLPFPEFQLAPASHRPGFVGNMRHGHKMAISAIREQVGMPHHRAWASRGENHFLASRF